MSKIIFSISLLTIILGPLYSQDLNIADNPQFETLKEQEVEIRSLKSKTVAVIDTGVDYTHPDLKNNIFINKEEIIEEKNDDDYNDFIDDVHGWDFADNDPFPYDLVEKKEHPFALFLKKSVKVPFLKKGVELISNLLKFKSGGHGTHVSGIIIRNNPKALVSSLRVNFKKKATINEQIQNAVEYAGKNRYPVVNMSLGGPWPDELSESRKLYIESIIQSMKDHPGSLFVVAAGNDSKNIDKKRYFPASVDLPNVLTIGAIDDKKVAASFTNYGDMAVDLYAPGVDINSTWPKSTGHSFKLASGTSMATPFISALAIKLHMENPELVGAELKEKILSLAKPIEIEIEEKEKIEEDNKISYKKVTRTFQVLEISEISKK